MIHLSVYLYFIIFDSFLVFFFFFFFSSRRRHTRSKRDWSSDVCSSDLAAARAARPLHRMHSHRQAAADIGRRWCRDSTGARMGRAGARTSGTSRDDPGLIYPNVEIGQGTVVHEGAIVGEPPRGATAGEL